MPCSSWLSPAYAVASRWRPHVGDFQGFVRTLKAPARPSRASAGRSHILRLDRHRRGFRRRAIHHPESTRVRAAPVDSFEQLMVVYERTIELAEAHSVPLERSVGDRRNEAAV